MTVAEYTAIPDGPPWYELIGGVLVQEPPPSYRHQRILGDLYSALDRYFEEAATGEVVISPFAVYLDDLHALQPDLTVVLYSRRAVLTSRGVQGPPDLVVEILSPSNRRKDLGPKREAYARFGVQRLWIIDPEIPALWDYDLPAEPVAPVNRWTQMASAPFTCPLLPGFTLAWDRVFRPQREE